MDEPTTTDETTEAAPAPVEVDPTEALLVEQTKADDSAPRRKRARKRKAAAAAAAEADPEGAQAAKLPPKLELDVYEVVEVHRSELKDAPYNPRIMDDKARAKLKRGIKRIGNLGPPIWNRRSGHIIGGHRRLELFDSIHGSPDYRLKVAAVDLDENKEVEANVLLNNPEAQGDWDFEKLGAVFHDFPDIDLDGTGFDVADVYRIFGDAPFEERDPSELDELSEKLRGVQQRYTDAIKGGGASKRDGLDYYLVVVFRNDDDRASFLASLGLPDNRFQDGRLLRSMLKPEEELS
jgi:hypothetical protein